MRTIGIIYKELKKADETKETPKAEKAQDVKPASAKPAGKK